MTLPSAIELAALVQRGEASPVELVREALVRVESINPALNAIVQLDAERALSVAASVHPGAPLAGVPFLLKDLVAEWEGVPLSEGSEYLAGYVSSFTSGLVSRYLAAGLVPLGRTNTPEFGILATTEPRRWGPARNPWRSDRITGGSSGGSAAAVAARIVPAAHGNDGGGSLRIPASACGVFGFKPSRGRVSLAPAYGDLYAGLVAEHAITVSVRDSALLLDVVSGTVRGDPYAAPALSGLLYDECSRPPGVLRIACVEAMADSRGAELLRSLGHVVEPASPALDPRSTGAAFVTLWTAGVGWTLRHWERVVGRPLSAEHFEPLTWELYQRSLRISAADYLLAVEDLQAASRVVGEFFAQHDLWLAPTTVGPLPRIGDFDPPAGDLTAPLRRMGRFVPYTWLANVTGCPAMSVPLFMDDEGLPSGSHFMAMLGGEPVLFRLAAQLEAALPWAGRVPAVAAEVLS